MIKERFMCRNACVECFYQRAEYSYQAAATPYQFAYERARRPGITQSAPSMVASKCSKFCSRRSQTSAIELDV